MANHPSSEPKQSPLQTLYQWQGRRLLWGVLFAFTAFLELAALGFQYFIHLDPCELCVYQRLAVFVIMAGSLVMMIAPKNALVRVIGFGFWFTGAVYGLKSAIIQAAEYAGIDIFNATCSFLPTFPFKMPLHEWMPSLFMPTGICGMDDWTFLGMNMAQMTVIVFSGLLLAALLCAISSAYCWFQKK